MEKVTKEEKVEEKRVEKKKEKWKPPVLTEYSQYIDESEEFPVRYTKKQLGERFVKIHQGPTGTSNWLIPNLVMMSAYPFAKKKEDGIKTLKALITDAKIDVFVCLQTKHELKWFQPYQEEAKKIKKDLQFVHFGIVDGDVPDSLSETKWLVDKIKDHMEKKERVLIHCHGGHGRTGTIVSCLLGSLYRKMMFSEIMKRCQACHDCRARKSTSHSPERVGQMLFVSSYLGNKRVDNKEYLMKE